MAQMVKNLPAMQETWVWSLGWEDPRKKEMVTHFSIPAWRIPWTENPGGLQSTGLQKVWHGWANVTQFSSVQSLSHVRLFSNPWTAARQASLSIINSQSLLKLMSIESVMPSNHLLLCRPLLLPPSVFPSIKLFSSESVLHIRWPKYWSFSFNISPSNEYSGLISFRIDWFDLLAVQGTLKRVFSNTTVQKRQFLSIQFSL